MRLVQLILVRDEADIIVNNLNYHLEQGVDHIVAIDNGSKDGTREILEDYARQGVASVLDEPGRDYAQGKWMTRGAHYARDELAANWLICSDADEFFIPYYGTVRSMLKDLKDTILICPRRNFFCAAESLDQGNWQTILKYYLPDPSIVPSFSGLSSMYEDPLPCPQLYMKLPPKVIVPTSDLIEIEQGNHGAKYSKPIGKISASLAVHHYPVRSTEQFELKIKQGGDSYKLNTEFNEYVGWHWRRWYRMLHEKGISAVLSDVFPDADKLEADLAAGDVVAGEGLNQIIRSVRSETPDL